MLRPRAAGVGEKEASSVSDLEVKVGRTDDGLEEGEEGVQEVGPNRVQAD